MLNAKTGRLPLREIEKETVNATNRHLAVKILIRILAIIVGLIGLLWLIEDIWLTGLIGPPYYLIVGIVFIIASVPLWRLKKRGAWLVAIIAFLSIPWVVWLHGVVFWAFFPQLLIPMILAALALLLMLPFSKPGAGRTGQLVIGLLAVIITGVVFGFAFVPHTSGLL